jgi:hypothetical protein
MVLLAYGALATVCASFVIVPVAMAFVVRGQNVIDPQSTDG